PSLAVASPASSSSSVDLPHPEGPTTAKNSPWCKSRSSGPSACRPDVAVPCPPAGKYLVTSRSRAWTQVPEVLSGEAPCALLDGFDVIGKELGVDDLAIVHFARDGADRALHLDHALHAFEVNLPGSPIRNAVRDAGGEIANRRPRHGRREIVVLGDDVARFVRIGDHEGDGAAPRPD